MRVDFDPTIHVPAGGVMMCPVDNAAHGAPLVLTSEPNPPVPHHGCAWCEIDVVGDKHNRPAGHTHQEALMPGALRVVDQRFRDCAVDFDLDIRAPRCEELGDERIAER